MYQQLSFFENAVLPEEIVNVASVMQRSPFRYPGGKTWLVPQIRRWLKSLGTVPTNFVEPFCGGGIVSLTVAFENLAQQVTMVELDEQVAAVWQTILGDEGIWLAEKISQFDLTIDSLELALAEPTPSLRNRAFQTILKNRVNRGGILAAGAGRVKQGENGKGLTSRWYPQTLKKRIIDIVSVKQSINFVQGDGLAVLRQNAACQDAVFFIDPPYTVGGNNKQAGSRLYNHFQLDHQELFRLAYALSGNFLMTYENSDDIRKLAELHGFDTAQVFMKNTHHEKMAELLIGRNLDWFRKPQDYKTI